MIEAAARGLVDFRHADPLDKRWWFRLRLVLDELERGKYVELERLHFGYAVALLSKDNLTDDSRRKLTKDAQARLTRIDEDLRPWLRHQPRAPRQDDVAKMSAAWARRYGDPNDPKTQAAIAETVRLLQLTTAAARRPKDAATVRR